jgi:arylsulfatase A-like enzyme
MMRASRLGPLLPFVLATATWGAGALLVLRHAMRADDYVMAEIRRHALVGALVRAQLPFLFPYVAAAALALVLARGVRHAAAREPGRAGWTDGVAASALYLAVLAWSTAYGMLERPAGFAGIFYAKGGAAREFQLALEHHVSLRGLAVVGGAALVALARAAAAGFWRSAATRRRRWIAVASAGILAALAGVAALASTHRGPNARGPRPNVLVVLVDSLRPDRVFPPEGTDPVAPFLARLAAESVAFPRALTPLARTVSSMTSLLTGLHPLRHGVRTYYPDREERELTVDTLPRALSRAGYRTIAVAGYCGTILHDVPFGFDFQRIPASEFGLIVSAAALRAHPLMPIWLRGPWARRLFPRLRDAIEGSHPAEIAAEAIDAWRASPGPFFEVVFFDNPHQPYVPVAPEALGAGGYDGPNRYSITAGDLVEQVHRGETGDFARTSPTEESNVKRLYDGAVAGVDRAIGSMLARLNDDGLTTNTIVLVLGDHGENLLDAGGPLAHGEAVERDRSNEVPLLVKWPGHFPPRRVSDAVSLMDVAPTILEAVGSAPLATTDGVSLSAVLTGAAASPPARTFLLETDFWFLAEDEVARLDPSGRGLSYPSFTSGLLELEEGTPPHVVIAERWREQVLRAKERRFERGPWALTYLPRAGGAAFHLFDRSADPWCTRDVSGENGAELGRMVREFYAEAGRLGDRFVDPPEDPKLARSAISTPSPTREAASLPARSASSCQRASTAQDPGGSETTILPAASDPWAVSNPDPPAEGRSTTRHPGKS